MEMDCGNDAMPTIINEHLLYEYSDEYKLVIDSYSIFLNRCN